MYRSTAEIIGEKISVVNRPSVKLSLSADDWALYDDYDNTGRYANRDNVATGLNDYIANAINTSNDRAQSFKRCKALLEKHSYMGCNDTEGQVVLEIIMTSAYGDLGDTSC
jgi:hypothetical protein